MTERIILSLVAIIMVALTLKKGDKRIILLTAGLTFGILITWTAFPMLKTAGLIIYMLTGLIISFSHLKSNELTILNRTTIVIAGLFTFGANLFSIMHWPYAGVVRISMVIPIALFIISLFNGMIKRKEIGHLTIMNLEFIIRLIR